MELNICEINDISKIKKRKLNEEMIKDHSENDTKNDQIEDQAKATMDMNLNNTELQEKSAQNRTLENLKDLLEKDQELDNVVIENTELKDKAKKDDFFSRKIEWLLQAKQHELDNLKSKNIKMKDNVFVPKKNY